MHIQTEQYVYIRGSPFWCAPIYLSIVCNIYPRMNGLQLDYILYIPNETRIDGTYCACAQVQLYFFSFATLRILKPY